MLISLTINKVVKTEINILLLELKLGYVEMMCIVFSEFPIKLHYILVVVWSFAPNGRKIITMHERMTLYKCHVNVVQWE